MVILSVCLRFGLGSGAFFRLDDLVGMFDLLQIKDAVGVAKDFVMHPHTESNLKKSVI
jgi:hypothetical protein